LNGTWQIGEALSLGKAGSKIRDLLVDQGYITEKKCIGCC